jgi:hypothetical protein
MLGDCCPECGHLLSNNRNKCPFCDWDENIDQLSYAIKIENDLAYHHGPDEYRPDQLPGF